MAVDDAPSGTNPGPGDPRGVAASRLAQVEQVLRTLPAGDDGATSAQAADIGAGPSASPPSLAWSAATFRAVFDEAPSGMLLADDEGRYLDANRAACELFGRAREELLGRHPWDLAAHPGPARAAWRELLDAGSARGEFLLRPRAGRVRRLSYTARANLLPGRHLIVLHDVTAQRETEYFLHRAQAIAHVGSWVWDVDNGGTLTWSPEIYRIFGLAAADGRAPLGADAFYARVHPDDRAAVDRAINATLESGTPYEIEHRIVRPDGAVRWIRSSGAAERDADGVVQRMIGVVTDITERHQGQEALRASERRYRRIVETAAEGIATTDERARLTFVNARLGAMLGYEVDELIGRDVATLFTPEQLPTLERNLRRRRDGASDAYVTTFVRRDGSTITVEVNASPLVDDAGRYEGTLAMITDVTARARAEREWARLDAELGRELAQRRSAERALRDTEEQLRQLQKLDAIGSLAAGVAHDFNNILSVIISYATLARDALGSADEPLRDDLDEILGAAERAADLTRQLLAFSRRQMLAPRVVSLDAVIAGLERMLRRIVGEHIELAIRPSPGLGMVLVDPGQFEQVMVNVVVNARDAMPRGGRLAITTANVEYDAEAARAHVGLEPGAYVLVEVTDTGVGMDAATRERMFEPFFTTKEVGRGTGLGMATVFGIVRQSGGHVWVQSEPGQGTTVQLCLPRTDREASLPSRRPSVSPSLRGGETVLVVDDEEGIREVIRHSLERHGYRVLCAANAGEALLICERHAGPIHLLLSDVVMPMMSGRLLAERLAPTRPAMRVLFVSGYTDDDAMTQHGVSEAGGAAFLQKPVRPAALVRKVREVLDAPRPEAG